MASGTRDRTSSNDCFRTRLLKNLGPDSRLRAQVRRTRFHAQNPGDVLELLEN